MCLCVFTCAYLPSFPVSVNYLNDQLTNLNVTFITQTNVYRFKLMPHRNANDVFRYAALSGRYEKLKLGSPLVLFHTLSSVFS